MRVVRGAAIARTSSSVNRSVMCCGQFQSKPSTDQDAAFDPRAVTRHFESAQCFLIVQADHPGTAEQLQRVLFG